MKKINPKVGDIVRIEFDDHSEGAQHIVFEIFGRVASKSRRDIVVSVWKYAHSSEVDANTVEYTILRAAIKEIQILSAD